MKLLLTDVSGKECVVESDHIRILEPADGGGTHIAFDADQGRVVKELPADICAVMGVTAVAPPPAPVTPTVASVASIATVAKSLTKKK